MLARTSLSLPSAISPYRTMNKIKIEKEKEIKVRIYG